MRTLIWLLSIAVVAFTAFRVTAKVDEPAASRTGGHGMHVVLIGASIGKAWNLPELPKRVHDDRHSFEALQVWDYDKSEAVEETLIRPSRKFRFTPGYVRGFFEPSPRPADLVILKECSSYFGGEVQMKRKQELFQHWVEEVREKNIPVMVATIVPITRARAEQDGVAKHRAILQFNDWVRAYAKEKKLPLLDLERALRTDDKERYLRDEFTSGDGSHLNRAAYDVLDRVMIDSLCEVDTASCRERQALSK